MKFLSPALVFSNLVLLLLLGFTQCDNAPAEKKKGPQYTHQESDSAAPCDDRCIIFDTNSTNAIASLEKVSLNKAKASIYLGGKFASTVKHTFEQSMSATHKAFGSEFLSDYAHAFHVSRDDLEGVLANANADGARLYVGIGYKKMHLLMVPTVNGNDTILTDSLHPNGFVFDFITPCPKICDKNGSPLEQAYIDGAAEHWPLDELVANPCLVCTDYPYPPAP